MEKEQSKFVNIVKKVLKGIGWFFKGIYNVIYSIRFIFYIPVMTLVSSIIGFMIVAVVKTLLGLVLPVRLNNGFVEMLIFAIIFISLNVYIFVRHLDEDLLYNWKKPLILNYLPVIFCAAACVFLVLDDLTLESFDYLIKWEVYIPQAVDEIYSLLLPFYAPHLWLGCLTGEFLWSSMACMLINCAISVTICLVIGSRRDKGL